MKQDSSYCRQLETDMINIENTTNESITTGERLRTHPQARFSGEQHVFQLNEVAAQLAAEAHPAANGHRQITVLHRDNTTIVLFVFDQDGQLREHAASGLVTIHILYGQFEIKAADQTHLLEANSVLVLDANVRHSVVARQAGQMLLTVQLNKVAV
jgi:quercetin dioxygenase-like cupin family protein